jgi:hypothetical protein
VRENVVSGAEVFTDALLSYDGLKDAYTLAYLLDVLGRLPAMTTKDDFSVLLRATRLNH